MLKCARHKSVAEWSIACGDHENVTISEQLCEDYFTGRNRKLICQNHL